MKRLVENHKRCSALETYIPLLELETYVCTCTHISACQEPPSTHTCNPSTLQAQPFSALNILQASSLQ